MNLMLAHALLMLWLSIFYLEFDVAMLNRAIAPLIGMGLPQPRPGGYHLSLQSLWRRHVLDQWHLCFQERSH